LLCSGRHAHFHTSGTWHIYQGLFKAFPIETDSHLYTVLRYVERNALRANLVEPAEDWRYGKLRCRESQEPPVALHAWPLSMPTDWIARVNEPQSDAELAAVRRAVCRGQPFGSAVWQEKTARQLGLQPSLRALGRPRNNPGHEEGMLF